MLTTDNKSRQYFTSHSFLGQTRLKPKQQHDQMVAMAERMLELQQKFQEEGDNDKLNEEIRQLDERIDQLVYRLYDLTKEEIAIIEKEK